MTRVRSFVILDALVTLPLLVWTIYAISKRPASDVFWYLLIALFAVVIVVFPSLICLLGKSLSRIMTVFLVLFYMVVLSFLVLLASNQMQQKVSLIDISVWFTIAKSIYGAVSVTKQEG